MTDYAEKLAAAKQWLASRPARKYVPVLGYPLFPIQPKEARSLRDVK